MIFNGERTTVTNLYFDLPTSLLLDNNSIRVIAKSSLSNHINSSLSNEIIIKKLENPVINEVSKNIVWEPVSGATSYDIYINDKFHANVVDRSFRKISDGTSFFSQIYIIAIGDGITTYNSDKSNIIEYPLG